MCSIHANTARDALAKLCTLPLLASRNIDSEFVVPTVASSMDVVVHCELQRSGQRRVVEIIAPSGQSVGSALKASLIHALPEGELQATGAIRHAPLQLLVSLKCTDTAWIGSDIRPSHACVIKTTVKFRNCKTSASSLDGRGAVTTLMGSA